jgi:hypothetical protein
MSEDELDDGLPIDMCCACKETLALEEDIVAPAGLYHRHCYEAQTKAMFALAERNEAERRANFERQRAEEPPQLCNFCGESCILGEDRACGLDGHAEGGYWSTPGNGQGALDDGTRYSFRICEFCLDWLFEAFVIPVKQTDYGTEEPLKETWRPASQRVDEDSWRKGKEEFRKERDRRASLRRVSWETPAKLAGLREP